MHFRLNVTLLKLRDMELLLYLIASRTIAWSGDLNKGPRNTRVWNKLFRSKQDRNLRSYSGRILTHGAHIFRQGVAFAANSWRRDSLARGMLPGEAGVTLEHVSLVRLLIANTPNHVFVHDFDEIRTRILFRSRRLETTQQGSTLRRFIVEKQHFRQIMKTKRRHSTNRQR